jgi:hypothetical protein
MAAALSAVVEGGEGVEAARGEVVGALMRARWGEEAARGGRGGGAGVRGARRGHGKEGGGRRLRKDLRVGPACQ